MNDWEKNAAGTRNIFVKNREKKRIKTKCVFKILSLFKFTYSVSKPFWLVYQMVTMTFFSSFPSSRSAFHINYDTDRRTHSLHGRPNSRRFYSQLIFVYDF